MSRKPRLSRVSVTIGLGATLLLVALTWAAAVQPEGEKYALLVGVREYDPNELRSLPYAEADVEGLAQVLIESGYRERNVVVMTQKRGAARARSIPLAQNIRKELNLLLQDRTESDYVLKCDVRKFFPSVDHEILKSLIARKVKDRDVIWLANRIIDHSNEQEPVIEWFAGDDLLTPSERRRGLPIGNQTSQFFANVYLNPFDHFVKETLRARGYIRYVDDFVIFSDDKEWLADVRERCREFLATLRLRLHPNKSVISRVADGTRFLGFRMFPDRRRLVRENVVRMKRRLRRMAEWYADGSIGAEQIRQRLMSWIGHARHADTYRLRARLFGATSFVRGAHPLRTPRLCVRHSSCPQEVSRRGAETAEG